MKFNLKKTVKRVMAMTLICSLLCNAATADAASTKLKNYAGNVSISFRSPNYNEGAFTGKIFLSGGVTANLKVTVEAYHYATSYDKRQDVDVRNYKSSHSCKSHSVAAGGQTISYPICSKKYPCRALAAVNGSYQGKAEMTE